VLVKHNGITKVYNELDADKNQQVDQSEIVE